MKQNIKQILREGLILEQRIKHNIDIPEDIVKIKNVFKKNGYKLLSRTNEHNAQRLITCLNCKTKLLRLSLSMCPLTENKSLLI